MKTPTSFSGVYIEETALDSDVTGGIFDAINASSVSFSIRVTGASTGLDITAKITASDFPSGDFFDTGVDINITGNGTYGLSSLVYAKNLRLEIVHTSGDCVVESAITLKGA